MNKVIRRLENLMLGSLTMAALSVIVGLVFMIYSKLPTGLYVIMLGSYVLVQGLFHVIRYLYDGLGKKVFAVDLIVGVVTTILGVFTFMYLGRNVGTALSLIGIFYGVWLIVLGLEKLYFGAKFVKAQEEIYPLVCFIGLLLVVMGVLAIVNPFETFILIIRLVGLFMICSGLLDAMTSMLFRRRAKAILKLFK